MWSTQNLRFRTRETRKRLVLLTSKTMLPILSRHNKLRITLLRLLIWLSDNEFKNKIVILDRIYQSDRQIFNTPMKYLIFLLQMLLKRIVISDVTFLVKMLLQIIFISDVMKSGNDSSISIYFQSPHLRNHFLKIL